MGCLLNFSMKLGANRRRWRNSYLISRQRYRRWHDYGANNGQIANHYDYLWSPSFDLICGEDYSGDYDDKHVISCSMDSTDNTNGHDSCQKMQDRKDGSGQCFGGNYDSNCEICAEKAGTDTHHEASFNAMCQDGHDSGSKETSEDEVEHSDEAEGLLRGGCSHPHEACCQAHEKSKNKKKAAIPPTRARGIEGYWQRQAYLRTAYKLTRRKTLCERIAVPVRKLRTAWGMVRGLYVKQAKCMQGQLKCISSRAKFHHASFLLLSKHYFRCHSGPSASISFLSVKGASYFRQW